MKVVKRLLQPEVLLAAGYLAILLIFIVAFYATMRDALAALSL